MEVIIKVDEVLDVIKKTKFKFYKEGQVPKGTKQPYFTYRGSFRTRISDKAFAFTLGDDSIDIMKSDVYLQVLKKWQVALNLTLWGSYDRASAEMEPLDYVFQVLNKTRGPNKADGTPAIDVNQSKWKIGTYKLFYWGNGWNVQQGYAEKESDRKTNINVIFDVQIHSDIIAIPTEDETETILKESKEFNKNIKEEV